MTEVPAQRRPETQICEWPSNFPVRISIFSFCFSFATFASFAVNAFFLLVVCVAANAAESPEEFAFALPVEGTGGDAFYRVVITQPVYEAAAYADLRDLRVFNGIDEAVPYAFRPVEQRSQKPEPVSLPFFPLRGPRDARAEDLDLSVGRSGDKVSVRLHTRGDSGARKVLLGYLIDASEFSTPLSGLTVAWGAAPPDQLTSVRIEAGDDLKHWTTLVLDAPLGSMSHAGQRLERNTIEYRRQQAKYLRLTWVDADRAIDLKGIRGLVPEQWEQADRIWKEITATPDAAKAGDFLLDLGGRFPIDRLEFRLPQENTLIPVQVFSRNDARDKWMSVASTVAYRLTQDGRELVSPALALATNTHRYWLLRVDTKAGGIGAGVLAVKVGWTPRELIFNARGTGPFRIAYGNARAEAGSLPLETLVPGMRTEHEPKIALANTAAPQKLAGTAATAPRFDARKWALWAALLAGVALLAWMAWRLMAQMQEPERK